MKNREVKRTKKSGCKRNIELPDEIWVEIVVRFPFRSIVRLKAVCKEWKRLIETVNFRREFMFAHRNSSSSWSIMHENYGLSYGEVVGFHGCERYGVPRSLASYIPSSEWLGQMTIIASVDGLTLLQRKHAPRSKEATYSVGNPVLNQWVQLPPHPSEWLNALIRAIGLVTRVEDGVVVAYKVVFMEKYRDLDEVDALIFEIYSSDTGKWIRKLVHFPHIIVSLDYKKCISLNHKLHWVDEYRGALVAYDFFDADEQQQCRVIPFPSENTCFESEMAYTTSGGFLVYMSKNTFQLRLWKLEEYTIDSGRSWQLMQDINLLSFGISDKYYPLAMHPFENHIIYMGSNARTVILVDLKTLELTHYARTTYSKAMFSGYSNDNYWCYGAQRQRVFYIPQFILPKWMGSVPPLPSI